MSETESLKTVALNDVHVALGAKMVPFGGYSMPVQYENLIKEHKAVRDQAGIFDVSHMGEFIVRGENALDTLQWVTTNDVSKLEPGKIQYTCFPNETGGIVDDFLLYQIAEQEYLLVVNASNIDKDWDWINKHNKFGAEIENVSDNMGVLAIQGPDTNKILSKLTSVNLEEISFYNFVYGEFAGVKNVLISNTGYTGSGGFELYADNKDLKTIWDALMEAGKEFNLTPCGLGSRDTLRLEKGYCLYGNDIDETTSPIEAGLGWITKFSKDFINKDFHEKIKSEGAQQKLVGFEMVDRGIPRHGYPINNASGEVIGRVTSGTMSPSLGKAIGLGYVKKGFNSVDSEIFIDIRGKNIKAKITKIPFL